MKRLDMWDAFQKTGRIDDYLRYRGIDVYDMPGREGRSRHDDRRTDYQGKQQYR